jgi:hypothetical protein
MPLFASGSNLVGWITDKHIFDTSMRWVGYISGSHAWHSQSGQWIGPVADGNVFDREGRPIAWSTKPVGSPGVPMRPMKPMKPMKPMRPVTPMKPMKPMKVMTPMGGWSNSSFQEVFG